MNVRINTFVFILNMGAHILYTLDIELDASSSIDLKTRFRMEEHIVVFGHDLTTHRNDHSKIGYYVF